MIHPGKCRNCMVTIYGMHDHLGGYIYLHKPSFFHMPCDNPEPYPPDNRPCTCDWPHYNCVNFSCKCVRHQGQIH